MVGEFKQQQGGGQKKRDREFTELWQKAASWHRQVIRLCLQVVSPRLQEDVIIVSAVPAQSTASE